MLGERRRKRKGNGPVTLSGSVLRLALVATKDSNRLLALDALEEGGVERSLPRLIG
jgi:hypothetical protein